MFAVPATGRRTGPGAGREGVYERDLGPILFRWSAARMAEQVDVPASGTVLELACGTGISTEALREALPADVTIVATDHG